MENEAFSFVLNKTFGFSCSLEKERTDLIIKHYAHQYGGHYVEKKFQPTDEDWIKFWRQLRCLGVWKWKNSYYNPCCDGTSWNLNIENGNGRNSSEGSNSYPGVKGTSYGKTFTSFLEAINQLAGEGIIPVSQYSSASTPQDAPSSVIFNSFTPTYQYRIEMGEMVSGNILDEELWQSAGVVYARVHEKRREVVYIGKTDGILRNRINDHLRRIPRYLKQKDIDYREWAEGKTITIYAHKPKRVMRLGLSISTHVGLESALIDSINPLFVSRR
jgi:hypothetical protein